MCDGSFDHYFALNGASPGRYGKFGVCESCPDQSGAQANCSIEFTRNYLRTNGTMHWKHPGVDNNSTRCKRNDGDRIVIVPSTHIARGDALPPAAVVVQAESGPRF